MLDDESYDKLYLATDTLPVSGAGCFLGFIDQCSWLEHPAYAQNIHRVFQINDTASATASCKDAPMHGAAVLSIAVGNLGIAKDAKVIYCAMETAVPSSPTLMSATELEKKNRACVLRNHARSLMTLQRYALDGGKLDAISTSHGWMPNEDGAHENNTLVKWFEAKNIPVFSTNDDKIYPCGRRGLAEGWRERSPSIRIAEDQIAIPVDHRLLACRNQIQINQEAGWYYRHNIGGGSWAVPFKAGLFALARECCPEIMRTDFEFALRRTARKVDFGDNAVLPVPDIAAFVNALTRGNKHLPSYSQSLPAAKRPHWSSRKEGDSTPTPRPH